MEAINVVCADGYKLSARYFKSKNTKANEVILICSATAMKQTLYREFAQWLNDKGYSVLTFDYRGVGDSLYVPLRDCKARMTDWFTLDIPAAIDTLLNLESRHQKITMIGHSAGGAYLGLVHNIEKVKKVVSVGSGTGHANGLPIKTRAVAIYMFKFLFPLVSRKIGYCPVKSVGMGVNLPPDIGLQWGEICLNDGHVNVFLNKTVHREFHKKVTCPITYFRAIDDEITSDKNMRGLMPFYPNAHDQKIIELQPEKYGLDKIGHINMFKKSHSVLWEIFEDELKSKDAV